MNEMNYSLKGFDDWAYLRANPDVSEAVQNGSFSSGWDHYIAHGFKEQRPGVHPDIYKAIKFIMEDDGPFPPEHLRKRVHGAEDFSSFVNVGRTLAFDIYAVFNSIFELGEQHRILDFGCGCGRVIRHFSKLSGDSSFYGTDIDGEAITWCKNQLSQIGKFVKNEASSPLPFGKDLFDFIYSISVFTHLPEDMQFFWLEELRRITKPGGYLVLTTHGEDLFNTDSDESKRQFREKGFIYSVGPGTEGLPDFYQTTFHSEDYIHHHWGRYFEIIKIVKKGIAQHQDLVLCRKPD